MLNKKTTIILNQYIKEVLSKKLLSDPTLVSIGIAEKVKENEGRRAMGEPSILFTFSDKKNESELGGDEVIKKQLEISGIKILTDVAGLRSNSAHPKKPLLTNNLVLNSRDSRIRPLRPGIGISSIYSKDLPGTLCYFFKKGNDVYLLTNHHVLPDIGSYVIQPSITGSNRQGLSDVIGIVEDTDKKLDCSIVKLFPIDVNPLIYDLRYPISLKQVINPYMGMKVLKSGIASFNTEGVVNQICCISKNDKGDCDIDQFRVVVSGKTPPDCEISKKYDSGSPVIEVDKSTNQISENFAGILTKGDSVDTDTTCDPDKEYYWATSSCSILERFKLEFI